MDLKFGLAVPSNYWSLSLSEKQKASAAIYDGGFDHLFMADHVSFRNGSGTDGFVDVAALSQLHEELGVMISIYLLPLRHPLPVARQLATMSKIASGRFIFGVGIGGEVDGDGAVGGGAHEGVKHEVHRRARLRARPVATERAGCARRGHRRLR